MMKSYRLPTASALMAYITCGLILTAGCSSSTAHRATTSSIAPNHPAFSTRPGQDAALIAEHITGCAGVRAGNIGAGGKGGMTSTANCTLHGHLVIVDSWESDSAALVSNQLVSAPTWYAHGSAWTAFLADPGQTADTTTLQMQLTNNAAGLLGPAPTPASLDVQQAVAREVARDLGGYATEARPLK